MLGLRPIVQAGMARSRVFVPRGYDHSARSILKTVPPPRVGPPIAHATYLESRSFASLDGLRALSIAGVVWLHTTNGAPGWPALRRGFLGVDFFFIISGFLIVTLLLRERRRTGTISLTNFYARRSLRILPAYWAVLLLVACAAYIKPGTGSAEIKRDLPYALLYLSNLVPMASLLSITWSLATEEQFYLIVPALQKYLPRLFSRVLLPIIFLLAILPPFGVLPDVHMPEFFRQTTFGPILLGVILAYTLDHPRGWAVTANVLRHPRSPLFALALLVLALGYPGQDISGWPRLAIHVSMAVLLASCVVREGHILLPVLTWWPIRRVGVVSYGIYLYHLLVYWPVSRVLDRAGVHSKYALFVCVAACSWFVAELSYRYFELRFLALKKRFSSVPDSGPRRIDIAVAGEAPQCKIDQ
jgi:peptidoglycan/LPS O-acetylase OafA/YrhL